ncbi:DUF3306 domain-containing protein [Vibrio sp. ZSDZ34]|uniref:DUF3306 domain-containing protein n=1 Tax=Vibrio gelatinilyticus TaxID=2893468 RepID=A0A9X2AYE8_9VIBR|nr:DUF3306 domain-containing protein [Vibrio gelatinilyticus]
MANNFIHRWSKRKLDSDADSAVDSSIVEKNQQASTLSELTAASSSSTPDTGEEALTNVASTGTDNETCQNNEQEKEELSVAQLLVSEADKSVKKAALRKLFMSPEFNVVDGLNDYDHDYASVKSLSSDVAATLRNWVKDVTDEPEPSDEIETVQSREVEESSVAAVNEPTELVDEKDDLQESSSDTLSTEDDSESSNRLA